MIDRILAFILLILLFPILIVLLVITFFNLRCNPVFIQKRTTNGDKEFLFYKIRSMKKESPNTPTYNLIQPEKYITRWGAFLRKNSLDELLNLVSIFLGDMHFLGPRPIMTNEWELIALRKLYGIKSKPGLTGFAQINGRDHITVNRKVACERYYESNKTSIRFRIYILLKTIEVVLRKTGISH
jgi:O-antigen biosynthesis protein WbqP